MDDNEALDGLITEQEARELLTPHFGALADCHTKAWSSWRAITTTQEGKDLGPSARARMVWDMANANFSTAIGARPGVFKRNRMGLIFWDFGRALVRFKKFRAGFETRGIETEQRRLLEDQDHTGDPEQLQLFPKAPMLIVGYVLNKLSTEIDKLYVVLQRYGRTLWSIEIPIEAMPVQIPTVGTNPVPPSVDSTRRSKEDKEKTE
jgi:hypothetical protein